MATQIGNESALGDYHIYDYSKRLSLEAMNMFQLDFINQSQIFKTYVFKWRKDRRRAAGNRIPNKKHTR